jgi:hypothetical protein
MCYISIRSQIVGVQLCCHNSQTVEHPIQQNKATYMIKINTSQAESCTLGRKHVNPEQCSQT